MRIFNHYSTVGKRFLLRTYNSILALFICVRFSNFVYCFDNRFTVFDKNDKIKSTLEILIIFYLASFY